MMNLPPLLRFLSYSLLLLCGLLSSHTTLADDPKPYVFGRAVALCIGIEKYSNVNEARYAEADAKAIGESLQTLYGFKPNYLLGPQATKDAILKTVRSYASPRLESGEANPEFLGEKDVLIVFFAGHGQVVPVPIQTSKPSGREGFLVPFEAKLRADLKDLSNPDQWQREAVDMRELVRLTETMKAQHVLLLIDACCSGFMTQRGNSLPQRYDLQFLLTGRSRAVVAATTEWQGATGDEKRGHGFFSAAILDELALRSTNKEAASLTDIFENVRFQVSNNTRGSMLPQMNSRIGEGDGEFVFLPKTIKSAEVDYAIKKADVLRENPELKDSRGTIFATVISRAQARNNLKSTVKDVVDAYDAHNYRFCVDASAMDRVWRNRVERYVNAAATGDVLAMSALYFCYSKGLGTTKDDATANRWAREAYDTGLPAGLYVLGESFVNGVGVTKNVEAGRRLYQESAEKQFPLGQLAVALALLEGTPREVDVQRGISLLEQAAGGGSAFAQIALGQIECGIVRLPGVIPDLDAGRKRLTDVAEQGTPDAMFVLSNLERALKNQDAATKWLIRAGENGVPRAQSMLTLAYNQEPAVDFVNTAKALGLPRNLEKAKQFAELASSQNQSIAYLCLAIMYKNGDGVLPNDALARKNCEKAVALNFAPAMNQEAVWRLNGVVFDRDDAQVEKLFLRSARLGNIEGSHRYALWLESKGERSDNHLAEIIHWHTQAAKRGNAASLARINENLFRICSDEEFVPIMKAMDAKYPQTFAELSKLDIDNPLVRTEIRRYGAGRN